MLSKKYRITKKIDFDRLYGKGALFQSKYLRVFILPNKLKFNRLSVIVSKKISTKATERNKIKRKIKNLFPLLEKTTLLPIDILILTLPGINILKTPALEEELKRLSEKIKITHF